MKCIFFLFLLHVFFYVSFSVSLSFFSTSVRKLYFSNTVKLFDFNTTDKVDKFDIDGILKIENLEKGGKKLLLMVLSWFISSLSCCYLQVCSLPDLFLICLQLHVKPKTVLQKYITSNLRCLSHRASWLIQQGQIAL